MHLSVVLFLWCIIQFLNVRCAQTSTRTPAKRMISYLITCKTNHIFWIFIACDFYWEFFLFLYEINAFFSSSSLTLSTLVIGLLKLSRYLHNEHPCTLYNALAGDEFAWNDNFQVIKKSENWSFFYKLLTILWS